jgi:hypothetical protein
MKSVKVEVFETGIGGAESLDSLVLGREPRTARGGASCA